MSEIQVGQINSTDGSTAITTGADGYVSFAKTQMGGRRNLIINGAMQVAQRGTSFSGFATSAYHLDRFQSYNNVAGTGEATLSQSSDAPDGFGNSYKIEITTADASPASTAEYGLYQFFEGQNLQQLKKGTSSAESVTLSFWVKSSSTGTFIVELMDNDNSNRHINKSYTINAANTWEYKTITFAGDTTGTLDNDNGNSFHVNWWLGGGSNYTSGTLQTSWGSLNQSGRAVGQTNVYATVSNTWQITGVQLEVGTVATPFEHRSYGEELALCQRYFEYWGGSVYLTDYVGNGIANIHFVPKRAEPSIVADSTSAGVGFYGASFTPYSQAYTYTASANNGFASGLSINAEL